MGRRRGEVGGGSERRRGRRCAAGGAADGEGRGASRIGLDCTSFKFWPLVTRCRCSLSDALETCSGSGLRRGGRWAPAAARAAAGGGEAAARWAAVEGGEGAGDGSAGGAEGGGGRGRGGGELGGGGRRRGRRRRVRAAARRVVSAEGGGGGGGARRGGGGRWNAARATCLSPFPPFPFPIQTPPAYAYVPWGHMLSHGLTFLYQLFCRYF